MKLLLLMLVSFVSPKAWAALPAQVSYTQRGFGEVMYRCPAKVWPGMQWANLQVLLSDSKNSLAWLVSSQNAEPRAIKKNAQLKELFEQGSSFDFLNLWGRKTIVVNFEGLSPEETLKTAVHELFHEVGQEGWPQRTVDERGEFYPLYSEPRYLRRMAFENLKWGYSYRITGRDPAPYLGAARYWLARWHREFPEEMNMETDSVEGTARYVDLRLAILLAAGGCSAGKDSVDRAFHQIAEPALQLESWMSLEEEGYSLGAMSSFLLTELSPNWFKNMDGSKMTSDLAVARFGAIEGREDEALHDSYQRESDAETRKISQVIEPELAKLGDDSFVRVSVPASWQKGNLSLNGSFVMRDRRELTVMFLGRNHRFSGDEGVISLSQKQAVLQTSRNECGGMFYFFVPKSEVKQSGYNFSVNYGGVKAQFKGSLKSPYHCAWLCPRE